MYLRVYAVIFSSGRNLSESEYVKLGAHHTLEIELQRPFTVTKEHWDSVALERIQSACDPGAAADVAAVIMSEVQSQIRRILFFQLLSLLCVG